MDSKNHRRRVSLDRIRPYNSRCFEDGSRQIDYILVSKRGLSSDDPDEEVRQRQRESFEASLIEEGLELEAVNGYGLTEDDQLRFVKLHAPFDVLSKYAQSLKMKMPIRRIWDGIIADEMLLVEIKRHQENIEDPKLTHKKSMISEMATELLKPPSCWQRMIDVLRERRFLRVPANVRRTGRQCCAPFQRLHVDLFDLSNCDEFFRSTHRIYLVDYILRRTTFRRFWPSDEDAHELDTEPPTRHEVLSPPAPQPKDLSPDSPDYPPAFEGTSNSAYVNGSSSPNHQNQSPSEVTAAKSSGAVADGRRDASTKMAGGSMARSASGSAATGMGIEQLLHDGTYLTCYPLHGGSYKRDPPPTESPSVTGYGTGVTEHTCAPSQRSLRRLLYLHWARWGCALKLQPLQLVHDYFGVEIAFYFAWLGFYTTLLLPAALVGIGVFIYGIAMVAAGDSVSEEMCANNNTMCPRCGKGCPYWNLSSACMYVAIQRVFDNGASVFWGVFMALWGTVFLELWKRRQQTLLYKWNIAADEAEEEPPRPEYMALLKNASKSGKPRYEKIHDPIFGVWKFYFVLCSMPIPKVGTFERSVRMSFSWSSLFLLFVLALAFAGGIVIYRIAVLSAFYANTNFGLDSLIYQNASLVVSVTAAIINVIFIALLSWLYRKLSVLLTDWELWPTRSDYNDALTAKLFLLQFANYYSAIFYIAFFKGRFTTHARMQSGNTLDPMVEECNGSSCMADLCVQMAIVMIAKQLLQNTALEILLPYIIKLKDSCIACCYRCRHQNSVGASPSQMRKRPAWEKDFQKAEQTIPPLYDEYEEMVIQYGFITIFALAFPLAPLFALLNNLIEIWNDFFENPSGFGPSFIYLYCNLLAFYNIADCDAQDVLIHGRRPVPRPQHGIGIWLNILHTISRISVITNGLILAFTCDLPARLVYQLIYSPDGSMSGYSNFSMSLLDPSMLNYSVPSSALHLIYFSNNTAGYCSYFDFRSSTFPYDLTLTFYVVLLARVVCFVVFENAVLIITSFLAQLIPDVPEKITRRRRHENRLLQKLLLELERKDRFRRSTGARVSNRRLKGVPPDIPEESILSKRNGATVYSEAPSATYSSSQLSDSRLPPISSRTRPSGQQLNSVRFGLPDEQLDNAHENEEQLAVVHAVARRNFDGASVQLEPIPQRVMRGRGVLHRLESASTNSQQSVTSSPVIVMSLVALDSGDGYSAPAIGSTTNENDEQADRPNTSPRTSDDGNNNLGSFPSIAQETLPETSFSMG